jgi:hypothetical protein
MSNEACDCGTLAVLSSLSDCSLGSLIVALDCEQTTEASFMSFGALKD